MSRRLTVKFMPPLSSTIGTKIVETEVSSDTTVREILVKINMLLGGKLPLNSSGVMEPGYIVMLDGVDIRVKSGYNTRVDDHKELIIIPVSHGG